MGEYAAFEGKYDVTSVVVTLTMGLALYNSVELLLLVMITFNEYSGLYFWSMMVSIASIMSYCNGLLIEYFHTAPTTVGVVLDNLGWMAMITGQSLVLYSRLGLIVSNRGILQAVKWMIIVDALVFYTSTTVLNFGARYTQQPEFVDGYFYMEQIQMTFFCVQEFIISGIYVWQTVQFLKVSSKRQRARKVMWQLFTINVVIIILDLVLLVIEYRNLHIYEQSIKAFVYSVKLKLEFSFLGKLIELAQEGQRTLANTLGTVDEYVRPSDSAGTRPMSSATRPMSSSSSAAAASPATAVLSPSAALPATAAPGRTRSSSSYAMPWMTRRPTTTMTTAMMHEDKVVFQHIESNSNQPAVVNRNGHVNGHVNGNMNRGVNAEPVPEPGPRPGPQPEPGPGLGLGQGLEERLSSSSVGDINMDTARDGDGDTDRGPRLQGRETDILYADIVRSISRLQDQHEPERQDRDRDQGESV